MRQEKLSRESVANAKNLRYLSLPPANVQTLRIAELEPGPYSSKEEVEYICLDAPIDKMGVLAACTNQSQPAKELAKASVKQILRRRIEKKN